MDPNQMSQMVSWLDAERRTDRVELTKLLQRLESQEHELTNQARGIEELEERLVRTQSQLARFVQIEERLEQAKNELALMVRNEEEQRKQDRRETDQLRLAEREGLIRSVNELRRQFQEVPRYHEELLLRRTEDQRLNEAIINLQQEMAALPKPIESQARSIAFVEQQVGQALRQVAALQEDLAGLLKSFEQISVKLPLIEELARRSEGRVRELDERIVAEQRQQQQFFETVRLAQAQQEHQLADWSGQLEAQEPRIADVTAQMRVYAKQHEEAQRALAALEKFRQRLEQEQGQVAELQRIAEVRQKQELSQWQEEGDRRWKKQEVVWEHQWNEQKRINEEHTRRLTAMEEMGPPLRAQIDRLWKVHQEHAQQWFMSIRSWQTRLEELSGGDRKE